jgi:hypothetical protein
MRRRGKHLSKRRKATVNKVSRRRQNRKMQALVIVQRMLAGCARFFYDRYRYRGVRAE